MRKKAKIKFNKGDMVRISTKGADITIGASEKELIKKGGVILWAGKTVSLVSVHPYKYILDNSRLKKRINYAKKCKSRGTDRRLS